jgi:uncharacterized radical SAM superfamily Fe-S cluster-containing enzyme
MKTLGITESVCNTCRSPVPAKVVSDGRDVFFEKFCRKHGASRNLVRHGMESYLQALHYVKPAWVPREFSGTASVPCPDGCGFCSRHEQHLCMPIVEITARCDLSCPICLVDAGAEWDMAPAEFSGLLDSLIAAERQIDILNLSGGEPLLHPGLLQLVDDALARPEIVRVSISTNGLALLRQPSLLTGLAARNVVVSLQFDGFRPEVYTTLRGKPLLAEKLRILDLFRDRNITSSLTMTAAGGVNDDQFPAVLQYFFSQPHIVSLMIQPMAFVGRARKLAGETWRLTIPEVVRMLGAAGIPEIRGEDFLPLPCSHPLCFSLAFYLMLDGGGMISLSRLLDAPRFLDAVANRTVFGLDEQEHQQMKDVIYDVWSGPVGAAPDGDAVMRTLRKILDELADGRFDPRQVFAATERRVKSIFLHAFQDAETFDLARIRRCCNAYPQPDGKFLPVCVRNVLRRERQSL